MSLIEPFVMSPRINRRQALSLAALPFVTAAGAPAIAKAAAPELTYDLSHPEDNVEVYVKITGSLADLSRTFLEYEADVFFMDRLTVPKPIYKVRGIARKDQWRDGRHRYAERGFDHGLICDVESGLVVDRMKNPLTGEVNEPIHYRSGPFERTIGVTKADGSPFVLDWTIVDGSIRQTQLSSGARKNWLLPEHWPRASTGDTVHFMTESTYIANVAEVNDRRILSTSADHVWLFATPFPPWMLMGDAPGFLLWRWFARKIREPDALDAYVVAEIERRWNGYFVEEQPWTGRINGWTQYCQERRPTTGGASTCDRG